MITAFMRSWKTVAAALAAVMAIQDAAMADLSGFQGRWRAVEMESSDAEASKGISLEHLSARIDIDGD